MSIEEIDRLLAYRKLNKYVNSADEFQKVTLVSDCYCVQLVLILISRLGKKNKTSTCTMKHDNHIDLPRQKTSSEGY
jgi:hypothetical protein